MYPDFLNTSPDSEGIQEGRHDSKMSLTTQKVSHPPVSPKYGAFAPARPFLDTTMAQ